MIDPKTLKPGQKVRIWMTGYLNDKIAEVTDKVSYGWPVLRLVDAPNGPLLKHEDYGVLEVLS